MKHLRLIAIAFALTACTAASIAIACGNKSATAAASKSGDACCAMKGKTSATAASASSKGAGVCTAEMAANCTPEMKAACAAMKSTATAAGNKKNTATVASMDHCAGMKASATTASMDHCAALKNTTAAAGASCSMKKKNATTAMAAGTKCDSHGNASAMAHGDCSACEDLAMCEEDVRATGARSKVVALKNGAMVVYTADTPENVRAVQTTVSRRNEQMLTAMKASTDGKLCGDCRSMRGAMASGKLHREVVNVESGCMTLITSTDRAIIQKIHSMTGAQMAVHIKN